ERGTLDCRRGVEVAPNRTADCKDPQTIQGLIVREGAVVDVQGGAEGVADRAALRSGVAAGDDGGAAAGGLVGGEGAGRDAGTAFVADAATHAHADVAHDLVVREGAARDAEAGTGLIEDAAADAGGAAVAQGLIAGQDVVGKRQSAQVIDAGALVGQ